MKYSTKLGIGVDQLVNALIGGYPDETISARAYRQGVLNKYKHWYIAMKFINVLFFFQDEHCYQAYISESKRKHSPIIYKD